MVEILMYITISLFILAFLGYVILILINRQIIINSKINGFDTTKEIISEYDSINVIESKNLYSYYDIKRKVIKLSTNNYYGNNICAISLSLIEAGLSVVDSKKNKFIEYFKKIFSNLKWVYIFVILSMLINYVSYTISDAKVSIIFIGIFTIIMYLYSDVMGIASLWVNDNIKKIKGINLVNKEKIINFINGILVCDKLLFLSQLVMLIRMVAILLEL